MWVLGAIVVLLTRERVHQVGWPVNMLEMGQFQFREHSDDFQGWALG